MDRRSAAWNVYGKKPASLASSLAPIHLPSSRQTNKLLLMRITPRIAMHTFPHVGIFFSFCPQIETYCQTALAAQPMRQKHSIRTDRFSNGLLIKRETGNRYFILSQIFHYFLFAWFCCPLVILEFIILWNGSRPSIICKVIDHKYIWYFKDYAVRLLMMTWLIYSKINNAL